MKEARMKELRKLKPDQREKRLENYRKELMSVRSELSAGGSIANPGRIKELKKTIARLLTIKHEELQKSA